MGSRLQMGGAPQAMTPNNLHTRWGGEVSQVHSELSQIQPQILDPLAQLQTVLPPAQIDLFAPAPVPLPPRPNTTHARAHTPTCRHLPPNTHRHHLSR